MAKEEASTREARRLHLLNAASELMATRPTASLADVAEHAGIGKATLHRYFASRDDLMLALGYRALERVADAIADSQPEQDSAVEAFRRLVTAMVPLGDKLHFLTSESILDTHPDFIAADRTSQEPVLRLIQRGQASGELRTDLPADWILHHLNYALFATWQSVHDGFVARRDAAPLLVTTLLGGIAAK